MQTLPYIFIALHLGAELEERGAHLAHEVGLLLLEAGDGAAHLNQLVLLLICGGGGGGGA